MVRFVKNALASTSTVGIFAMLVHVSEAPAFSSQCGRFIYCYWKYFCSLNQYVPDAALANKADTVRLLLSSQAWNNLVTWAENYIFAGYKLVSMSVSGLYAVSRYRRWIQKSTTTLMQVRIPNSKKRFFSWHRLKICSGRRTTNLNWNTSQN